MAYVEKTLEHEDRGARLTRVTIDLHQDANELLVDLMQRTGLDASDLVGWALGAYWRELEGIVLPPSRIWSEADLADIREGVAQADRGECVPQDVVEKEIAELLSKP